jgi:hypothetical protein
MRKILLGLTVVPFLGSAGWAGEATPLSNTQMDRITAGYMMAIPITGCDCYLYIRPPSGAATPMVQTPTAQTPTLVQPSLGLGAFFL